MAPRAHKFWRFTGKSALLIFLFCLAATQIDASTFISYETSSRFSAWLYGFSSQDNFDDLWFFTDVALSVMMAVVSYKIVLLILRKVRR